jgi:hypothetical protein
MQNAAGAGRGGAVFGFQAGRDLRNLSSGSDPADYGNALILDELTRRGGLQ